MVRVFAVFLAAVMALGAWLMSSLESTQGAVQRSAEAALRHDARQALLALLERAAPTAAGVPDTRTISRIELDAARAALDTRGAPVALCLAQYLGHTSADSPGAESFVVPASLLAQPASAPVAFLVVMPALPPDGVAGYGNAPGERPEAFTALGRVLGAQAGGSPCQLAWDAWAAQPESAAVLRPQVVTLAEYWAASRRASPWVPVSVAPENVPVGGLRYFPEESAIKQRSAAGWELVVGENDATAGLPASGCPAEMAHIGQRTLAVGAEGTRHVPAFCIGRWLAHDENGRAVHSATSPAIGMTWQQADRACRARGWRLPSTEQWAALVATLAEADENWTGGARGAGRLMRGHSDGAPAAVLAPSADDTDGYFGTDNAGGSEQRRTFYVKGAKAWLWDVAGNALQWTDDTVARSAFYDPSPPGSTWHLGVRALTATWAPARFVSTLSALPGGAASAGSLVQRAAGSANAMNTVNEPPDLCTGACTPAAAAARGGSYLDGAASSIESLSVVFGRSYATPATLGVDDRPVGFRCVSG